MEKYKNVYNYSWDFEEMSKDKSDFLVTKTNFVIEDVLK